MPASLSGFLCFAGQSVLHLVKVCDALRCFAVICYSCSVLDTASPCGLSCRLHSELAEHTDCLHFGDRAETLGEEGPYSPAHRDTADLSAHGEAKAACSYLLHTPGTNNVYRKDSVPFCNNCLEGPEKSNSEPTFRNNCDDGITH